MSPGLGPDRTTLAVVPSRAAVRIVSSATRSGDSRDRRPYCLTP